MRANGLKLLAALAMTACFLASASAQDAATRDTDAPKETGKTEDQDSIARCKEQAQGLEGPERSRFLTKCLDGARRGETKP